MKKNSKLTIVTVLIVMICLLSVYAISKYYSGIVNKEVIPSNIVNNQDSELNSNYSSTSVVSNDTNNEISLGDIANCYTEETRYKDGSWTCGTAPDTSYNTAGSPGSTQCRDQYGLNCTTCYQTKTSYQYCTKCNKGYAAASNGSCTQCSANYYGANGTSCTACGAGTSSSAGSDESGDCKSCAAGTYGTTAGGGCSDCDVNHKCTGGTNHDACPAGYGSAAKSSSCTKCPAGSYGTSAGGGCATCPAHKYCTGGTNIANCPAGTEGPNGSLSSSSSCTSCADGYISSAGSACTACGDGKISNKSHTKCCDAPREGYYRDDNCKEVMYPVTEVGGSSTSYTDPSGINGLYINIYQAKNNEIGTKVIVNSWTSRQSPTSAFAFESSGNAAKTTRTGTLVAGTGSTCQHNTVTVKATNNEGSAEATRDICVYCQVLQDNSWSGAWKMIAGRNLIGASSSTAGCIFYGGLDTDDDGTQFYTKAYSRCCGVKPPPSDYGACYGTEPYLGTAKKGEDQVGWYAKKKLVPFSPSYKYPSSVASNSDECVIPDNPEKCSENAPENSGSQTKAATICEDEVVLESNPQHKICSDGLDDFYSISCNKTVKTSFDYLDDGNKNSNNVLARGMGYRFGIDVTTDMDCTAEFKSAIWGKAYNRVLENLRKIIPYSSFTNGKTAYLNAKRQAYTEIAPRYGYANKEKIRSNDTVAIEAAESRARDYFSEYIANLRRRENEVGIDFTGETIPNMYALYNLATDIEMLVINYNNYEIGDDTYDEEAKLFMDYKINGSSDNTSFSYDFDSILVGEKSQRTDGTIHTSVSTDATWLRNPRDYKQNYDRKVRLDPKKAYVEKSNGIITEDNQNTLDGANKVYIDYGANDQTIPITIKVTGLAGNNSEVDNEKCSVIINNKEILYRPIDVANPFISDSWIPGDNWVNSQFDFRNIIHSDIWNS